MSTYGLNSFALLLNTRGVIVEANTININSTTNRQIVKNVYIIDDVNSKSDLMKTGKG